MEVMKVRNHKASHRVAQREDQHEASGELAREKVLDNSFKNSQLFASFTQKCVVVWCLGGSGLLNGAQGRSEKGSKKAERGSQQNGCGELRVNNHSYVDFKLAFQLNSKDIDKKIDTNKERGPIVLVNIFKTSIAGKDN